MKVEYCQHLGSAQPILQCWRYLHTTSIYRCLPIWVVLSKCGRLLRLPASWLVARKNGNRFPKNHIFLRLPQLLMRRDFEKISFVC